MKATRRRFVTQVLPSIVMASAGWSCAAPVRETRTSHAPTKSPAPGKQALTPKGASAVARPHYVVVIHILGGYDAVLTFDPKAQEEVRGGIECGYRADQRIRGRTRLYGPLVGDMIHHESDLCLVHGTRVDTVAHDDGYAMLHAGRHNVYPGAPLVGVTLGGMTPGDAPIDHMLITDYDKAHREPVVVDSFTATGLMADGGPSYVRPPWFDAMDEAQVDETKRMLGPDAAADHREQLRAATYLQETLAGANHKGLGADDQQLEAPLGLVLNAIRRNRAKAFTVETSWLWLDSHTENLNLQTRRIAPVFRSIAKFIAALKHERNQFGTLFEQTTIAIGSELGRFPKTNSTMGKDHWPENTWALLGKGIKPVTVGATNERYRGVPIDFRTGRADGAAMRPIFLESIFATLVHVVGGDLAKARYSLEDVLECVCA